MRKTSYAYAFIAVAATLVLNVLSTTSPNWMVYKSSEVLNHTTIVTYGFSETCERSVFQVPGQNGRLAYTEFKCRPFPGRVSDGCEKENRVFCTLWSTAAYATGLGIGFGASACLAIIFGVSTHSRRRRIWSAVAGLLAFHAIWQLIAFIIVTDIYRRAVYHPFKYAKPGHAYILNVLGWVFSIITCGAVVYTGISANKGRKWAAGNRAYRPISG